MPGKHLYEYSVIRLVPRVEREEFLNVGIILFSKGAQYLNCKHQIDTEKLKLFSCELEVERDRKKPKSVRKNLFRLQRWRPCSAMGNPR